MKRFLFGLLMVLALPAAADIVFVTEPSPDSLIIPFPLYDTTGVSHATGITGSTTGLEINVRADSSNGWESAYSCTQSGGDIQAITTNGTYEAPSASSCRFEEIATSAGFYELFLLNAAYDVTNATKVIVQVTDSGTAIMDQVIIIDMSGSTLNQVADAVWDEAMSGHTTAGTAGDALGVDVPAILTDTGTDIPAQITAMQQELDALFVWAGVVDTGGVTSQTALVVDPAPATDDYYIGYQVCIEDGDDANLAVDCTVIEDYVQSTGTFTLDAALKFTVAEGDRMWIFANDVDVNRMNDAELCGTGTSGDLWTGVGNGGSGCSS